MFGGEWKKAFQELKERLAYAETLGYFDKDAPTQVIADAGPVGLGAVLTQKQKNGPRVICYASRSHSAEAKEYIRFVAINSTPCAMSTRKVEEASAIDEELCAVKECLNGKPWDQLAYNKYPPRISELCSIGQLILRGTRIVIPKKLRPRVLSLAHEGHLGIVGTKQKLRSKVWWPGMEKDAEKHCKTCYGCQLVSRPSPPEPIRSTALPTGPCRDLAIDFSGHSPPVSPFWSSWTTIVATTI